MALLCFQVVAGPQSTIAEKRTGALAGVRTHYSLPKYSSLEQWLERRAQLRAQILSAAGLDPLPERTPLHVQHLGRIQRDSYAVEKVLIETWPGFYLAGNLYLPVGKPGKHPGVLLPHGHWKHGRAENLPEYSVPALGVNLAAQGYVAFAYDMVGYNDTQQTPHEFGFDQAQELWSFSPLGLQLWNSIRSLDFLESLPEVDASRLAVTGASGGGTQSYLLAAVDDRIEASAPVNMVSGIMQGDSLCENAPGLRVGTSNIELAAMVAPKPLLLVSTTADWTKNTPHEEFPQIRTVYELYGAHDKVEYMQSHDQHNYNRQSREAVYRFFRKHLLHEAETGAVLEAITPDLTDKDLLIGDHVRPVGELTYDQLFAEWKTLADLQTNELSTAQRLDRLRHITGVHWPSRLTLQRTSKHTLLAREGTDDQIAIRLEQGISDETVLLLDPDGIEHAKYTDAAEEARERGASVLYAEVFGTGSYSAQHYIGGKLFTTYNRTLDSLRVQDILTVLAFLHADPTRRHVNVSAIGPAQAWALVAVALSPDYFGVRLLDVYLSATELERAIFIPGLLRAGGMEVVAELAGAKLEQPLLSFRPGIHVAGEN